MRFARYKMTVTAVGCALAAQHSRQSDRGCFTLATEGSGGAAHPDSLGMSIT